jgi:GntR family transcriptional regulator
MNPISQIFSENQLKALKQEDTPTPLYFQLYSLLKGSILDGTIGNGMQMPTEQQLAESFEVSRITAKRAMDELAAESLVERRRGKGTHVTYEYSPKPVQAPLVGMLQEIESMARHSDAKVLECKKMQPPALIREALKLGDKDKALHLVRVRSRDGQPFAYYSSWTSGLDKPVTKKDFRDTTRLEIFRKQGLKITHVTQTISAIAATEELAQHLQTEVGAPLLSLTRNSYTTGNGSEELVDYLHACYHPDRFQYQMDLNMDNAG